MSATLTPGGAGPQPAYPRAAVASLLALALLTLLAFEPVRHNGFILFDDDDYLTRNAAVQRGLTFQGVALAFTRSFAGNWFPLTWLSHMLDVELFGLDPRGHHLMGLAIHAATALLLFATLRAMTGRAGPSFVVAALFAVHPLHVESVAWASERKDVLSAFFWMLTTALYVRYVRRPAAGRLLGVILCFALGLMAKQMLVTLPFVLLLLDRWPLNRWGGGRAKPGPALPRLAALALEKTPLLVLSAIGSRLAVEAQGSVGLIHSLESFPLAARVANATLAPVRYLGKTVWPVDLSIFYPYQILSPADGRVLAAGGFLAAASLAALLLHRRSPWLLTGWLWYLGTLLPVAGLVQIGDQSIADRYTYLPLVGVFVAGAWSLSRPGGRRVIARIGLVIATAALLLLLAGLTRRQVALWRDDATLFGHARRVTVGNWVAEYLLGLDLERRGDREGAIRSLRESVRTKPDFESSRIALARFLHEGGRTDEAVDELRAGVDARPGSRRLLLTLSRLLRDEGRLAERLATLRAAALALPDDHELRLSLALALADAGADDEAIAQYRELIGRWPNLPDSYNNLAALLARRGRVEEAVGLLRRALEIDPAYPDARLNLEALTGSRAP